MGNMLYAVRTYLFPLITGFRRARSTESTATLMSGGFNINARWCLRGGGEGERKIIRKGMSQSHMFVLLFTAPYSTI